VYTKDGELVCRGGGEMYVHNLAKALVKTGNSPTVLAIQEFKDQVMEEEIDGVVYKRVAVYSRTSFRLLGYLKKAVGMAKDYDFVVVNQFVPHLILPWVKCKKIAIIHDVYWNIRFWLVEYGFLKGVVGWIVEKLQLRFDKKYADTIFTVSSSSERKIISRLGEDISGKIQIVPNVVDVSKYYMVDKKENFLLFVGRFVGYKHPEHVLYALKKVKEKYPDFKAVFVISRVERKTMESFNKVQKGLGIADSDITINENCSYSELKKLYSVAKILVQPSFAEGQGIVILESLASGTPVIAYNLDAYEGMLVNDENSLLVEKGDFSRMASGCVDVLEKYDKFSSCLIGDSSKFDMSFFEKSVAEAFNSDRFVV